MVGSLAAIAATAGCGDNVTCDLDDLLTVVVYTRENQWVHPSNPVARDALAAVAEREHWQLTITDDPAALTTELLARTDVVVFSLTSGPVLDLDARARLETFFRADGGFVGTHSASSTEGDWAFYREMVPVTFFSHPVTFFEARIDLLAPESPLLAGLPSPYLKRDEFYTFNERPEALGLELLYAVDESSNAEYPDDIKVGFHPLAFTTEKTGNRVFYTALGHTPESYAEEPFMIVLTRAIAWAGERHHATRCE